MDWFKLFLELFLVFKPKRRVKILIVEDNIYDSDSLRKYVEMLNFKVKVVLTAEQAKGELSSGGYKVVFIDIRLPLMNGIDLIQFIKEVYPKVNNVIVLGEVHDLYKLPFGTFVSLIIKPVRLEAIKEALKVLS